MLFEAVLISIKVVTIAVVIAFLIALFLVLTIGNKKGKIYRLFEVIILLPMFIPPSAIGYIILLLLGRNGIIGRFLNQYLYISIIFTISAAVIASVFVILPIMYQNTKAAILSVDEEIKNSARDCGANEFQLFTKIILPLSKKGLLNGILLSSARAFGEFGATILVAGNIPGKTQTVPMAMYYAIETNNNGEAIKILILILAIAIFLMSIYSYLSMGLDEKIIRR